MSDNSNNRPLTDKIHLTIYKEVHQLDKKYEERHSEIKDTLNTILKYQKETHTQINGDGVNDGMKHRLKSAEETISKHNDYIEEDKTTKKTFKKVAVGLGTLISAVGLTKLGTYLHSIFSN